MISIDSAHVRFDLDQALQRAGNRVLKRLCASCWTIGVVAALVTVVAASEAYAVPLTPFRYEAQAQRHCPADTVVWLNFRKRTYYSKRQKQYALGLDGSFVCRSEARASGYRRSLFGIR